MRRLGLKSTAVAALALGVGAVTAVGSVVDGVLLRPLPWRAPHELVNLYLVHPAWRTIPTIAPLWNRSGLFWSQFVDVQTHSRTLTRVAAWRPGRPTLGDDNPEAVQAMYVSANFLPMLGVSLVAGRGFDPDADTATTDAVLIAADSASRRFGGAVAALGVHVTVDGLRRTIVGVFAAPFLFDPDHDPPEFCLPFGPLPAADKRIGVGVYYTVARLRPGLTATQAFADVEPVVRGTFNPKDITARVVPLVDDQLGPSRRPLWLLFGGAALLLAIAVVNVATLLSSDVDARRMELAIRQALGATRGDIVRLLGREAGAIALVGGALGILLATWAIPWLVSLAPERLPRSRTIAMNLTDVAFAIVVSGLAAAAASVWPAIAASARQTFAIRSGTRGATQETGQRLLVISQVAMTITLLVVVSLFNESLFRLTQQPIGFDADDLTVVTTRPTDPARTSWKQTADAVEALGHTRGVVAVAGVGNAPFSGGYGLTMGLTVDNGHGRAFAQALVRVVTDTYFATLRVPIRAGRAFDAHDVPGDHAAIVSDSFSDRYLNGAARGRRINADDTWWTVGGVVADTRQRGFRDPVAPTLYLLDRQASSFRIPADVNQFVVRTTPGVALSPVEIAAAVRHSSSGLIVTATTPMSVLADRTVSEERYRAQLSSVFGLAALGLAAIGLYGLLARGVVRRRREIGVRMALGARRSAVVKMIISQGGRLVVAGIVCGCPIAFAAARLTGSLLFGVTPSAPHTFFLVAGVLGTTALLAMAGPARQAASVDPLIALRSE